MRLVHRVAVAAAASGLLAGGMVAAPAQAVAPSGDQRTVVYKMCASKKTGEARLVRKSVTCKRSEVRLAYKVIGPPGMAGPVGPEGPQGSVGLTGGTGAAGPTGATGATGEQGIQGVPGVNGTNGTNGINGTNGVDGAFRWATSNTYTWPGTPTFVNQSQTVLPTDTTIVPLAAKVTISGCVGGTANGFNLRTADDQVIATFPNIPMNGTTTAASTLTAITLTQASSLRVGWSGMGFCTNGDPVTFAVDFTFSTPAAFS